MIEPLHSLAFSIQANPGIYAVLLGSGVSRSARIPTGWEITLDFVRKLAEVCDEPCQPDPATWYREKYGQEPDYSDLLDALAKTPAERQQLLRGYIEPTEEERAEGIKAPTAAHQAIAGLAATGHIRVIVTTNFDRLMETALADVGIVPTVFSSPDQVHGAMPLIHTRCCVFKVHGDYLDTRIRNTPSELESYPSEFNNLLDRIFDEFGLIVCGWSAEWDTALRQVIERSVSRRFSHFWALVGEPGNAAKRLIEHRQAQTIRIGGADSFFSELTRLVEALNQFSRPHPLSTEAAVASLKGYLAETKHRIRLADLINGEIERVLEATSGPAFAVQNGPSPDTTTFTARVRAYEAACETLLAMAAVGGYWVEDWHHTIWQNALVRLATYRIEGGYVVWVELQRYPATLLFYALGLGAIEAGERGFLFLNQLFRTLIHREHREDKTAVELLPALCLFQNGTGAAKLLEGMSNRYFPLNDWIHNLLRHRYRHAIPSIARFSYAFDRLEVLMALGYNYNDNNSKDWYWVPLGCYAYNHDNRTRIFNEIRESISSQGNESIYIKSGIFGSSAEDCAKIMEDFKSWVNERSGKFW